MAKLILSLDGQAIRDVTLSKERTTIGRKPHNDIQIDNLAVSGEHCAIMTILNDSFLEDLGSTNGTLVNGQPIKKHFLQHNDVIELGKYKLKYMNETAMHQQGAPGPTEFEKTVVMRPQNAAQSNAQASPMAPTAGVKTTDVAVRKSLSDTVINPHALGGAVAGHPASVAPSAEPKTMSTTGGPALTASQPVLPVAPVGTVQILSGPNAGKELPLVKALTTLGKPGVQVAVIAKRPQGYFITHVEGASFPNVNGKALDAQAHALNDHDVIELAGIKMEFFLKT
jgi:predicted component of type VI protein secretion system